MYLIKAFQLGVRIALTCIAVFGGIIVVGGFLASAVVSFVSLFR